MIVQIKIKVQTLPVRCCYQNLKRFHIFSLQSILVVNYILVSPYAQIKQTLHYWSFAISMKIEQAYKWNVVLPSHPTRFIILTTFNRMLFCVAFHRFPCDFHGMDYYD